MDEEHLDRLAIGGSQDVARVQTLAVDHVLAGRCDEVDLQSATDMLFDNRNSETDVPDPLTLVSHILAAGRVGDDALLTCGAEDQPE